MSQREDVLFCEIAITSGLVSKEAAKKVLAFCNKQEKEAGRRPLIGAVFTKYKILQTQDVQRVYDAVRKRTGRAVGAQRVVERKPKRGRSKARAAPPRKVDPKILWQGIGGMVVLAVVLFGMIWILTRGSDTPDRVMPPVDASSTRETPGKGLGDDPASTVPPEPKELSSDQLHKVSLSIGDAKSLAGDDPAGALRVLENLREKLEKQNYILPQTLLDALLRLEEKAKQQDSSEGVTESPAASADEPTKIPEKAPGKTDDDRFDELFDDVEKEEEE